MTHPNKSNALAYSESFSLELMVPLRSLRVEAANATTNLMHFWNIPLRSDTVPISPKGQAETVLQS